ncbi:MAG: hypothetical protein IJ057_06240 [Bacteroidales bacterium]|nr:hypothetical protein [Bacteroidales bacterium]
MKITYPECQIEISTDEVIDLLDYFEDRQPKVECREDFNHLNIKRPELHIPEISEEAKKEIEETIQKYMRERGSQLLKETDPNRKGEGIVPLIQKEPIPEFESGGIVPENPDDGCLVEGETVKEGASLPKPVKDALEEKQPQRPRKPKQVDVLAEDGWLTFDSQGKAAKFLGVAPSWLSKSLELGKTCNGHHVRYTPNPELDACLAEVEESNKKPYEPSRKP